VTKDEQHKRQVARVKISADVSVLQIDQRLRLEDDRSLVQAFTKMFS
jgi:hypothetical protein